MSILDPLLALLLGWSASLGAARGREGLFVSVPALVAIGPLLRLLDAQPMAGLVAALGVAGGSVVVAQRVRTQRRSADPLGRLYGAVTGAALAGVMVLLLITSLPMGRSTFDPNQVVYPSQQARAAAVGTLDRSWFMVVGRNVLFAPLLPAEDAGRVLPDTVATTLHRWLVVGEPWLVEGGAGP